MTSAQKSHGNGHGESRSLSPRGLHVLASRPSWGERTPVWIGARVSRAKSHLVTLSPEVFQNNIFGGHLAARPPRLAFRVVRVFRGLESRDCEICAISRCLLKRIQAELRPAQGNSRQKICGLNAIIGSQSSARPVKGCQAPSRPVKRGQLGLRKICSLIQITRIPYCGTNFPLVTISEISVKAFSGLRLWSLCVATHVSCFKIRLSQADASQKMSCKVSLQAQTLKFPHPCLSVFIRGSKTSKIRGIRPKSDRLAPKNFNQQSLRSHPSAMSATVTVTVIPTKKTCSPGRFIASLPKLTKRIYGTHLQ
jgi:hypothetical protein